MGAPGALSFGVVGHLLLGMCGMTALARAQGASRSGAWLAGTAYGLSGLMLSLVTLLQLLQAAAWAPWVAAACLRWWRQPTWRRAMLLAVLVALQVSTLSAEIVAQTALLELGLGGRRVGRRHLVQLAACGLVVLLLSAPALLGAAGLIEGTRRGAGFGRAESLALATNRGVLAEALLPRLFGGPLWYGEGGGWAGAYYPMGVPYLVSAYVGTGVLGLALLGSSGPLWLLALGGVLLSLGAAGPFADLLALSSFVRFPVKFLFLPAFALALLAGRGLDRLRSDRSPVRLLALLPPGLLLAAGLALRVLPQQSWAVASAIWPPLASPAGRAVCLGTWPEAWIVSGVLCTGAVLAGLSRFAGLAGPLVLLDLLIANAGLNPLVPRSFLGLDPEVRALVARARGEARWFSYGVTLDAGHQWTLPGQGRNLVALHRLMRQSLAPPTHVLDGLDGAFDVARTGWEPAGSTLADADLFPARFPDIQPDLRLAGVRWVLSFEPLPGVSFADLVGEAPVEGGAGLKLYALRDPLPRAFWVPASEIAASDDAARARAREASFDPLRSVVLEGAPASPTPAPAPPAPSRVSFQQVDPHQVRVEADTPPGYIVVLVGQHDAWRAQAGGAATPLWRANGRYWAVATPGGPLTFTFRFQPPWRGWALGSAGIGVLAALALLRLDARPTRG
jgi:hypothetical protein